MRILIAVLALGITVALGVFVGWVLGFIVLGVMLIALPLLVFRRSATVPGGPGSSGPGSTGYGGRTGVGDEGGEID